MKPGRVARIVIVGGGSASWMAAASLSRFPAPRETVIRLVESPDVPNVLFSNGWIRNDKDEVFIYYASADTRMHVATSTVEKLVDYCMNTPEDGLRSATSVDAINNLVDANETLQTEKPS